MQMLWCWRCRQPMPMLDEEEYFCVISKRQNGVDFLSSFSPLLQEYEKITGLRETNPNAVYHHRLAMYGPPCKRCGKPLRTPVAKLCGNCMHPVNRTGAPLV